MRVDDPAGNIGWSLNGGCGAARGEGADTGQRGERRVIGGVAADDVPGWRHPHRAGRRGQRVRSHPGVGPGHVNVVLDERLSQRNVPLQLQPAFPYNVLR
jgi:hypothetical protein